METIIYLVKCLPVILGVFLALIMLAHLVGRFIHEGMEYEDMGCPNCRHYRTDNCPGWVGENNIGDYRCKNWEPASNFSPS